MTNIITDNSLKCSKQRQLFVAVKQIVLKKEIISSPITFLMTLVQFKISALICAITKRRGDNMVPCGTPKAPQNRLALNGICTNLYVSKMSTLTLSYSRIFL
jgi:hypothetical protein